MNISRIALKPGERGVCFGTTRSGKSTLSERLIEEALHNPKARILLIDPKPRFKAQWQLNGLPANRLYRKMRGGAYVPYSLVLPRNSGKSDLVNAWKIARAQTPNDRGLCVIAQTDNMVDYPWLDQVMQWHYANGSRSIDNYTYVDELLAMFKTMRGGSTGAGVFQTVLAGGERGHAFLGSTQRPRWIPIEVMSEMTKAYVFKTSFAEDTVRLREMGLPAGFRIPREMHQFTYYDKFTGDYGHMRLNLDTNTVELLQDS